MDRCGPERIPYDYKNVYIAVIVNRISDIRRKKKKKYIFEYIPACAK